MKYSERALKKLTLTQLALTNYVFKFIYSMYINMLDYQQKKKN